MAIELVFEDASMARRPHPRLAAAQAQSAERMRQAAQQLREDTGPIKAETRAGLVRLLEAVPDQQGQASVYIWDVTSNGANSLLSQPLDESIVNTIQRERAGPARYW